MIRNAVIWPMTGTEPFVGDLLMGDGKILQIGKNLPCADAEVIEAQGLYCTPGFIDAHCHIGMWEDGIGTPGDDGNEDTSPSTPQLRAVEGVNPRDRCFDEALQAGITTVATGPGSANVIGGQFCALKTCGSSVEDRLVRAPVAMKVALGENPKMVYGGKDKTPKTRMASAAILRENLKKAQIYAEKENPDYDAAMEALVPVVRGELPLKIHAHRADDIQTAIRVMKEFGLPYTLEHCTEGYLIPESLKEANVLPIIGPLICERAKVELANLTMRAPALLWQHGIPFAIMTDHPVIPIQYLPVCAALAVREGCPEEIALQAITIQAACALGLQDTLGSLEPGKEADVVLFDGHPLAFRTKPVKVFVAGEERLSSQTTPAGQRGFVAQASPVGEDKPLAQTVAPGGAGPSAHPLTPDEESPCP